MRDSEMPLARAVRTKSASIVSSIDVRVSRATYAMDSEASTNPGSRKLYHPSRMPAIRKPSTNTGIETRSVVVTRTRLS
ncbi:Uncharacterised protein [Mycobacteroides abscessus subsp. abscessus]|nr:Uncharacterised protein [Mycobacteroides abscessus subsp. abscessus]